MSQPTLGRILLDWQLVPGVVILCALCAGLYVAGVWRARRWPAWRTGCFLIGVALIAFALCSGLDAYADTLLSIHMGQHLVLSMAAAPLLVAGSPLVLALRALPASSSLRRGLVVLIHSRAFAILTSAPVAWLAFSATMLLTHFTGLYSLALRDPAVHALEHTLYLVTGVLFWWPLLDAGPLPGRQLGVVGRCAYLLLAMPVMAFIGAVMNWSDRLLYPEYAAPARALGRSALADQHNAGALMWVGGKLVMALLLLVTAWAALQREEKRQRAREARAA
ncbi:MAG TPA: cytochrome c oxidase assembly protein [Thermoleophilaceae bacterium]